MKVKLLFILLSIAFCFSSCTSWRVTGGTSTTTTTTPPPTGVIGQRVKVLSSGQWYDATILNVSNDNQYYVHYEGWANNFDEWVTVDRVQFVDNYGYGGQTQTGQRVRVLQNNTWYDAIVLQVGVNNQYYVEYIGYGGEKEWVDGSRIQFPNIPPPSNNTTLYPGQKIHVYLNSIWHPATILQIINNKYYVKYDDITYYEWVTLDRIR